MIDKELLTDVANAIQQTQEQTEDTVDSLCYIFNKIKRRGFSQETVCRMIIEASRQKESDNPDIQLIIDWLRWVEPYDPL